MTLRCVLWVAVSTKTQAADDRESLPAQERELRALAEKNGWQITDVLIVPGHSRRYVDIHKCARDMAKQGIDAFDKLLRHWEEADFDILAVRDSSRFGRTQTLHAHVVEETIAIGAKIYSLADGEIYENNFRMFIAMGGYAAAGEIDNLHKRREIGYNARAARGLPVNSLIVRSHKLVRDPSTGRAIRVELDTTRLQEWRDLVNVVCDGVAWRHVETEMFKRYGYGNPLGEPHPSKSYYRTLYTPSFYGHSCRHFKLSQRGAWCRVEGHDVPPGVLIHYNTNPSALSPADFERLHAELLRRETIRGRMSPTNTYKFSGLLICANCKYTLSGNHDKWMKAWRCASKYDRLLRGDCPETKRVNERYVQTWLDARLRQWLADGAEIAEPQKTRVDERDLRAEIAEIDRQIKTLIGKQATASEALRDAYDAALAEAGTRLTRVKEELKKHQQYIAPLSISQRTLEELRKLGLAELWKLPDREINQWLFRLFGKWRMSVRAGEIIGLEIPPRSKKRY